ncbi:MAG: carboxylesterase/lipase family protein [Candidatus Hodarchaeales archaeon]|jgi:para-nitrobenzyl esterase
MTKTSVIETKSGKIQGYSENGIEIFKGIPFAEPPIEDLRFSPPVKKKPWDGVFDATKYGPCAYQGFTRLEEWFEKLEPESEDCLNLNIWTPATDNEKRPVMFWIHGGAFMMGSGISPIYEGSTLAKRGNVVVVTINYRLGALGYLYIPGVAANAGQLDQIAALEWVRDNIEYFGGAPENVTIFGESAGGYAVVTLPAMPAANGLFQKVIAQSAPQISKEVSEKPTRTLMRMLKIKSGDIESLRKLPVETIIEAQNEFYTKNIRNIMAFKPLIDGDTLPKHPLKAFQDGDCSDIDFMIGSTLEEAKLFTEFDQNPNSMFNFNSENAIIAILGMFGMDKNKSRVLIDTYKEARAGKYPTEPKEIFSAMITDLIFRIPTVKLLEAQGAHQPNNYNYILTWKSPLSNGALGSAHAIDIPFVFGTYDNQFMNQFVGKGPEVQTLSEKIMDSWIAFAHTGNPNHTGLPQWPSYKIEKRATMFLGKECEVVNSAFDKERVAWSYIDFDFL